MEDTKTSERNGSGNNHAKSAGASSDVGKKVTGEKVVKRHEATPQTVMVTFRGNRKFDLHVGRDTVVFLARETKPIPKKWLTHPDFRQQKSHFVVKGVS